MKIFIILAIAMFVLTMGILAFMIYHHVKGNFDKVGKYGNFLLVPLSMFTIVFTIALVSNKRYVDDFTDGIYTIDVSKLEQVVENDEDNYLDSFYDMATESGSSEIKIDGTSNGFHVIFPTETYDYEMNIGIDAMKLIQEQNIISIVKAEE